MIVRGDFNRVHILPPSSHDVQDDQDASLVVLGPTYPHTKEAGSGSRAITAAKSMLESRGNTPRLFRNTLVFLAADETRLQDLEDGVRRFLAWQSILDDRETLDLPPHQVRQAESQRTAAEGAVAARIGETYQWLLVPVQTTPQANVEWQDIRLAGQGPLAERASRRMRNDELLIPSFAGTRLRMELDRIPLWRGDHVSVRQLLDDFARFSYLPRLKEPQVLLEAIRNGLSLMTWEQDSFAYADGYDDDARRYRGLHSGPRGPLLDTDSGLLVCPDMARRQMTEEQALNDPPATETGTIYYPEPEKPVGVREGSGGDTPEPTPRSVAKRYHGSVKLDPTRVGRDASKVADEVIAHLAGLLGADVELILEIKANIPDGAPEQVVRIVIENTRELRFDDSGFESA